MSRDEISDHCLCDKCSGDDCEGLKEMQERAIRKQERERVLNVIVEAKKRLSFDSSFATDNAYNEGRLSAFNIVDESLRQGAQE